MIHKKLAALAIGTAAAAALAVPFTFTVAGAQTEADSTQQPGMAQQGGPGGPYPPPTPMPGGQGGMQPGMVPMGQGPMGPGPMMGGGAAMVVDGAGLYVLQGNRLYRLNKLTLQVEKEAMLGMAPPRGDYPRGEAAPKTGKGGGE